MDKTPRWVSVKEAANAVGVHERTVRRWLLSGAIVSHRLAAVAGAWRVLLDVDGLTVARR